MPVYEYHCHSCQRDFEYQQRMSDPEKEVCEACGGTLERMISRTAFALKGGGWYKDLYASSKPETTKSDSSGKAETSGEVSATPAAAPAPASAAAPAASSTGSSGSSGGASSSGAS